MYAHFYKLPDELLETFIRNELTAALTEVCKLLRLMLTIPITSTSAERSSPCLKKIKVYLETPVDRRDLATWQQVQ